ncbi:unnamed protein product [Rotaria sp. Silwood1]|nr:unnamed protein product [Rotaria sp. Silwood1]
MNRPTGNVSLETNPACISVVSLKQNDTIAQMRLCCQGMSSTTPAPYFPKECGKQLYTPLGQRIIGGSVVQPHSWVSLTYFCFHSIQLPSRITIS